MIYVIVEIGSPQNTPVVSKKDVTIKASQEQIKQIYTFRKAVLYLNVRD
jgi:hypothetical protein